jgi:hypothetical protein
VRRYDSQDRQIEISFYGTNGVPIVIKDGYARKTTAFNPRSEAVEESYFAADGAPIAVKGAIRRTFSYDLVGKRTKTTAWRPDGSFLDEPEPAVQEPAK